MRGTDPVPGHAAGDRPGGGLELLRALPDAVLVCATDGTVVQANNEAERLFGYAVGELVGSPIEMLVPGELAAAHRWHRERYAATEHARPMITGPGIEGVRKDGSRVPVEVNLASVTIAGRPAIVASVRDITEARRTTEALRASHELVSGVLSAATEQAIVAVGLDGDIEMFSRGAERMLGWTALEVVGRPVTALVDQDAEADDPWGLREGGGLVERIHALAAAGVSATRPWVLQTRRGERRHVATSVSVRAGADGPSGLILVATDETARREREAALARSEERFRRVFEDAPIGVAIVSLDPRASSVLLRANRTLSTMLGLEVDEVVGRRFSALANPEDVHPTQVAVEALASGSADSEQLELRLVHAEGREVWVEAGFSLIRDEAGAPDYVVAMLTDVTDRKRAEAELRRRALHDALTGLPNRLLVTQALQDALARSRQADTGAGVLYVDIDDFKQVNDSLGHGAGDELLVEVARRLEGCMRDSDVAGRFASDEFIVVCDSVAAAEDMVAVAERVARTLAIRLPLAGEMVTVSTSIGIAYSPDASAEPGSLLRQADIAMYRAKGNGRARFEFADAELQERATRQVELEADLRRLLAAVDGPGAEAAAAEVGELVLDYQPCFAAESGGLVACEALLRWRHPTRGLLGPGEFLDVAEDRALMVPLGAWVLRTACRRAAAWQVALGDGAPEVWVNVSAAQLGRPRFAEQVARTLAETGLAPERLWLEITERQALSTAAATLEDLDALAAMGVRLAVDDFGTGYAGLEYLRRLPVSGLKVDASYVAAIGKDPTGAALAATVVGLGRALGLTVVAEGIETPEQQSVVCELGVDVLQGFLLAKPGRPEVVSQLVRAEATSDVLPGRC